MSQLEPGYCQKPIKIKEREWKDKLRLIAGITQTVKGPKSVEQSYVDWKWDQGPCIECNMKHMGMATNLSKEPIRRYSLN